MLNRKIKAIFHATSHVQDRWDGSESLRPQAKRQCE